MAANILVSNLELVPGRRVKSHLGVVQGSTVREEAVQRMLAQAASVGANAVLNVRFATTSITAGAAEILAYGTAVVLE